MSEATKNRRPTSGSGPSAAVLTVALPAGDAEGSGLGKKSAAALGKTLRKAAKAADEAGLQVVLDLTILTGGGSSKKARATKGAAAGSAEPEAAPKKSHKPATESPAPADPDAPAATRPAPVKRAAAAQLPAGRRPPRSTVKTPRKRQEASGPAVAVAAPTTSAEPSPVAAGTDGTGTDGTGAPSGARRPRRAPRRTPARPPVTS